MRIYLMLILVVIWGCSTTTSTIETASTTAYEAEEESSYANNQLFQIASPILSIDNRLFTHKTTIKLALAYPNTSIYYTLDGSEPTPSSKRYTQAISLTESGNLKAKAFHPNHLASNTAEVSFLKIGKQPSIEAIKLNASPHKNYTGKGTATLFDQAKGSLNFRTTEWLGFNGDDVEILIALKEKSTIHQLTVSTLCDVGSWIFPPSAIEVWEMNSAKKYDLINKQSFEKLEEARPPNLQYLTVDFPAKSVATLKVVIKNNGPIPEWHDGKGTPAWLFLDEIILQ